MTYKTRIKIVIHSIIQIPYDIRDFGIILSYYFFVSSIIRVFPFSVKRLESYIFKKKKRKIYSFLKRKYSSNIATANFKRKEIKKSELCIWTCWWQGLDNAPVLVQKCIKSVQNNSKVPVIIIDKNNYQSYCSIPHYIINLVQCDRITMAHFCDVIRLYLLSLYGGFWFDATLFVSKSIPSEIFDYDFFSRKGNYNQVLVSGCRWSGFFMGGKNTFVFEMLYNYLLLYWKDFKNHSHIIDYFLLDYFFLISYNENSDVRLLIDKVPYNNADIHSVEPLLNKPFEGFPQETYLYKLTYKMDFVEEVDGLPTYYNYIVKSC